VVLKVKVGDSIKGGDCAATIYCRSEEQFAAAHAKLSEAFQFSDSKVDKPKLIKASIS
jgi:thymidine phosphorylase